MHCMEVLNFLVGLQQDTATSRVSHQTISFLVQLAGCSGRAVPIVMLQYVAMLVRHTDAQVPAAQTPRRPASASDRCYFSHVAGSEAAADCHRLSGRWLGMTQLQRFDPT